MWSRVDRWKSLVLLGVWAMMAMGGTVACGNDEGQPASEADLFKMDLGTDMFGPALISLTTEGDIGADRRVDIDRFPKPANGDLGYARTFELPAPALPEDIRDAVIVIHGLPTLYGDAAQYDGDPRSGMDSSAPLEMTLPVACGVLKADDSER